jgi:hypothetical protein
VSNLKRGVPRTRLLSLQEVGLFFGRTKQWVYLHSLNGNLRWPDGTRIEPTRIDHADTARPRHRYSLTTTQAMADSLKRFGKIDPDHYEKVTRRISAFMPGRER